MECLADAIDILKHRGYAITRRFRDSTGCYAVRSDFKTGSKSFYLVAKQYAYVPESGERFAGQPVASFMRRIVQRACDKESDVYLVFYNDDEVSFTVFGPHYVKRESAASSGESKTRFTEWYQLPADRGVDLRAYEASRARPPTLDTTRPTSLDQFARRE